MKLATISIQTAIDHGHCDKLLTNEYVELSNKVGLVVPCGAAASSVSSIVPAAQQVLQPVAASMPLLPVAMDMDVQSTLLRFKEIILPQLPPLPVNLLLDLNQIVTGLAGIAQTAKAEMDKKHNKYTATKAELKETKKELDKLIGSSSVQPAGKKQVGIHELCSLF